MEQASQQVDDGVDSIRLRLLDLPVTDYVRFEYEIYRELAARGERILGIESSLLPTDLRHALHDFVLFDERLAFALDWNQGIFRGAWLLASQDTVRKYCALADRLLDRAVPFDDLAERYLYRSQ